ncbi:hypothetical protein MRX96_040773 [Rhipicephalus microplus]|uniref:Kinesin motor domain-containing protein n=1 Tax=Rhipicephalus microplus TaxID=6941 RepID=A0A9J6EF28_RHIMP|nr:kinesin-like protein KIN-7N [Rhipicephalus microplus]KAH8033075.1 hypothetical protein HPB51_006080 [Rhipicephalus microplus]
MSYPGNPVLLTARSFIDSTAGNWNANTPPDIKVAERVRPLVERDTKNGEKPIWKTQEYRINMESRNITRYPILDHVFDYSSTNLQVYQQYCHPIVESVMLGFNGTIFAFGQMASGKFQTMMGSIEQLALFS